MGKNRRRRRRPQLPPSAFNIRSPLGRRLPRPPQSERISFDDGLRQLLSVCRPHRAARRLYEAWCDGDCAVWCDGTLLDPSLFQLSLSVDVWTDDDGCEQLKLRKATDMVGGDHQACVEPFDRSLAMASDQTSRRWEVSAAGIAALLAELSSKQIAPVPMPPIKVQLINSKVQLVEKSTSRARTQSPSQPTEDQIRVRMDDVSDLSDTEKQLRRYMVIKHGDRWRDVFPANAMEAAKHDPLYEKEIGVARWTISTWRRALDRKK
jgi:hypothetical protein